MGLGRDDVPQPEGRHIRNCVLFDLEHRRHGPLDLVEDQPKSDCGDKYGRNNAPRQRLISMPDKPSVETIAMSATDDASTHPLGLEVHMRRRSRRTYSRAWFPNTSVMNANVRSSSAGSPSLNLPAASSAVEKPCLHIPRTIAAAVILRMLQTLGDGAALARSVVSDMDRKSLVRKSKTIRAGVKTACPVRPRPIARKRTISIFLTSMLKV